MPTIAEAIREGARRLQSHGVSEERRTAGVLLASTLGVDRTHLLTKSEGQIDEAQYQAYLRLVDRRAAGEPLQYITGHQEFYRLDFIVNSNALIPRPETEFLVEQVIKLARAADENAPLIVDVGTGSGCIAVAIAANITGARIVATDISGAALEVARKNAERHGLGARIEFVEGDLLEPLARLRLESAVDFLASNPPYVEQSRPEMVQREVREWEPHEALFGGADGLNFYRRLLADGLNYVKPGGYLVCEIGYSQLCAISDLIARSSWELIDVTCDLQGIPRTITARKMSGKP
ncbi:MAG TPA: peptide chain release factor N(5)-glutamine methyltransferase [Blastocatellia bacterium]|nr:peptide chain release factor N(5)-glutamine methyltransferase [Blastocatellia bacterium]